MPSTLGPGRSPGVRGLPQRRPRRLRMALRAGRPSVHAMTTSPLRVLVAGGGVAGIEALPALRALAGERVELPLADASHDFTYRPMKIAEPFARGTATRHAMAAIARDAGAPLGGGTVVSLGGPTRPRP